MKRLIVAAAFAVPPRSYTWVPGFMPVVSVAFAPHLKLPVKPVDPCPTQTKRPLP